MLHSEMWVNLRAKGEGFRIGMFLSAARLNSVFAALVTVPFSRRANP